LDDFSFFSSIALAVGAAFNVFFILSGCCISGSLTNHGIYPRNQMAKLQGRALSSAEGVASANKIFQRGNARAFRAVARTELPDNPR
jgi:hypothetical protein